ncbi:unnamed protein product, partial [marine sediment metagenome]
MKTKKTKAEISEIFETKNDAIFDVDASGDLTKKQLRALISKLEKDPLAFDLITELKKLPRTSKFISTAPLMPGEASK